MPGIVGAATFGVTDAVAFVSAGTGVPFVVSPTGPVGPATGSAPAPAAPTPAKSTCSEEKEAAPFQILVGTTGTAIIRDQLDLDGTRNTLKPQVLE